MSDLFRREAVAHATRRLAGDVVIGAPLSGKLLSTLLVVVVAAAVAFAALSSYARRETVPGWLSPHGGMIRVQARHGGVVEAIHVREGASVAEAAPIATLRLSTDTSSGDTARTLDAQMVVEGAASEAQAAAVRAKLRAQRADLAEREASLTVELAEHRARVRLLEQRQALAEAAASRGDGLFQKGFLARAQLEQLRATALNAAHDASAGRTQTSELARQIAALRHELQALVADAASADAQAAQARAALSQRRMNLQAQSVLLARAPIAGRVLALPLQPGQVAPPGGTVAVLVPKDAPLTAELYVPSRAAGFIRPGQEVRLMYQAFPHQTFGTGRGVVRSVSDTVLAPSEVSMPGLALQEPVFRVRVALDRHSVSGYGRSIPLQPGMLLTADVIIDRRSLLQWLLDPLYAVGRRS